jgi:hypothetical protein
MVTRNNAIVVKTSSKPFPVIQVVFTPFYRFACLNYS